MFSANMLSLTCFTALRTYHGSLKASVRAEGHIMVIARSRDRASSIDAFVTAPFRPKTDHNARYFWVVKPLSTPSNLSNALYSHIASCLKHSATRAPK